MEQHSVAQRPDPGQWTELVGTVRQLLQLPPEAFGSPSLPAPPKHPAYSDGSLSKLPAWRCMQTLFSRADVPARGSGNCCIEPAGLAALAKPHRAAWKAHPHAVGAVAGVGIITVQE